MLAGLLNVPTDPDGWNRFALTNMLAHQDIIEAIAAAGGPRLPLYPINPIFPGAILDFLQNDQKMHQDMNSTLGLAGSDLEEVDINDERQLAAWIGIHHQELYAAAVALRIGP